MVDWVTDAWLLVLKPLFGCCGRMVNWTIDWLFNWLSGRLFESWLKANFVLWSCHVAIDSSVHLLIIISDKMIGSHLAKWALINLSSMINYCNPSEYKSLCTCEEFFLPKGFWLFWLQIRHCGFLTGWPGTCSTNLQNISGPDKPQVALADMFAMVARFNTAGNNPGKRKYRLLHTKIDDET